MFYYYYCHNYHHYHHHYFYHFLFLHCLTLTFLSPAPAPQEGCQECLQDHSHQRKDNSGCWKVRHPYLDLTPFSLLSRSPLLSINLPSLTTFYSLFSLPSLFFLYCPFLTAFSIIPLVSLFFLFYCKGNDKAQKEIKKGLLITYQYPSLNLS